MAGRQGGEAESERLARRYFSLVGAGELEQVVALMHPDVELSLKTRAHEVLRGREAVARFIEGVATTRVVYEATALEYHPLDDERVIVEGRMRWMDEDRVLRDDPVVWALEFDSGLLRRSTPARSFAEAKAVLGRYDSV
jgi:ketosteroid isomerase-like protein